MTRFRCMVQAHHLFVYSVLTVICFSLKHTPRNYFAKRKKKISKMKKEVCTCDISFFKSSVSPFFPNSISLFIYVLSILPSSVCFVSAVLSAYEIPRTLSRDSFISVPYPLEKHEKNSSVVFGVRERIARRIEGDVSRLDVMCHGE